MRITVGMIVSQMSAGESIDELLADFPMLEREDILQAMQYALANGYTVLTRDLDFGDILAATHGIQPSIVQIRTADARPGSLLRRVADVLTRLAAEIEQGAIVTIDETKTRIHILPFASREL
jgi:uncharacterized protein (DUF433 family)